MPGQAINIGAIEADLQLNSKHMERGIVSARGAIAQFEKEIKNVQAALKRGLIDPGMAGAQIQGLTDLINRLETAQKNAYASGSLLASGLGIVNANVGKLQTGVGRAGLAMMQFGYMIDDMQYGFQGVVNNIGPAIYAMSGGNMSLSAGAQVAGVAIYQLYTHWTQLTDALGVGAVRTEAERMEELGNKTHKTADETERLNKFKKEQASIEEMLNRPGKAKEEHTKAVKDAIAEIGDLEESGGQKIAKGIADVIRGSGLAAQMTDEEKDELENLRKKAEANPHGRAPLVMGADGAGDWGVLVDREKVDSNTNQMNLEAHRQKVQDRLDKIDSELAKKMLANLEDSPKAIRALLPKVRNSPGAFPKDFANTLSNLLPENRARQKDQLEGEKNQKEIWEQNRKEIEAAQKEAEAAEKDRVKKIAEAMRSGPAGMAVLSGHDPRGQIQDSLATAGMLQEDAKKLAPKIATELIRAVDEKVRDTALGGGITEDEARRKLEKDATDKMTREATTRAKEMVPDIGKFAEDRVLMAKAGGGDMATVRAQIQAVLEMADKADGIMDLTADQLKAATDKIMKDANQGVNEDVLNHRPQQEQRERATKAEQFDAMALAQKVQAGVGNGQDETKKQTSLQEQMRDHLKKLAENPGKPLEVAWK